MTLQLPFEPVGVEDALDTVTGFPLASVRISETVAVTPEAAASAL